MLSRTSVAEEAYHRPPASRVRVLQCYSWTTEKRQTPTVCKILLSSWDEMRLVILADSLGPSLASPLHFIS